MQSHVSYRADQGEFGEAEEGVQDQEPDIRERATDEQTLDAIHLGAHQQ